MWGKMIGCLLFLVLLPFVSEVKAQAVPDYSIIEKFETFEQQLDVNLESAFELADAIILDSQKLDSETSYSTPGFRADLALVFAEAALSNDLPMRALAYLEVVYEFLPATDIRLTQAYDLADKAHIALGNELDALRSALMAYNTAEVRLGPENPVLLARLNLLEPRVRRLRPSLVDQLEKMVAVVKNAQSDLTSGKGVGDPEAVRVWYGTNRLETGSIDPLLRYGYQRGKLSVGQLTVTIPPGHLSGKIETPLGWFKTKHFDPKKHMILADLKRLAQSVFAENCCSENDRLLFVHGFNTSFYKGALRAAQLSFDLEFRGEMMYFSWPSRGTLLGYFRDAQGVDKSRPAIIEFLELATRGTGKLHIVAHSMGNLYMLDAFEKFIEMYPERKIGEIILAAPDVDRGEFEASFPTIKNNADGVTLYASKKDLTLQVSRVVNLGNRAGDSRGKPLVLAGLDSIDASAVDADLLGHSYFGDTPQILGDILGLVRMGLAPPERCGIKPYAESGDAHQWEIEILGCPVEVVRAAADLLRIFDERAPDQAKERFKKASDEEKSFWGDVMEIVNERLVKR